MNTTKTCGYNICNLVTKMCVTSNFWLFWLKTVKNFYLSLTIDDFDVGWICEGRVMPRAIPSVRTDFSLFNMQFRVEIAA